MLSWRSQGCSRPMSDSVTSVRREGHPEARPRGSTGLRKAGAHYGQPRPQTSNPGTLWSSALGHESRRAVRRGWPGLPRTGRPPTRGRPTSRGRLASSSPRFCGKIYWKSWIKSSENMKRVIVSLDPLFCICGY